MSEKSPIQRHGEWIKAILPRPRELPNGQTVPDINIVPMTVGGETVMMPSDVWHMPCPLDSGDVLHDDTRAPTWRSVYGVEAILNRGGGAVPEVCHMFQYLPTKEWGAVLEMRKLPKFFLKMGNTKEYGNAIDEFVKANLEFTGAKTGKTSAAARSALYRLIDKVMTHSATRHGGGIGGAYRLEKHIAAEILRVSAWFMGEFSEEWKAAKSRKGLGNGGHLRRYQLQAMGDIPGVKGGSFRGHMARALTGELIRTA